MRLTNSDFRNCPFFDDFSASVTKYEIKEYDSVAYENATVIRGNARFTVLTNAFSVGVFKIFNTLTIISSQERYVWSTKSKSFEDRPTLAVVNRKVLHRVSKSGLGSW